MKKDVFSNHPTQLYFTMVTVLFYDCVIKVKVSVHGFSHMRLSLWLLTFALPSILAPADRRQSRFDRSMLCPVVGALERDRCDVTRVLEARSAGRLGAKQFHVT